MIIDCALLRNERVELLHDDVDCVLSPIFFDNSCWDTADTRQSLLSVLTPVDVAR